MSLTHDDVRKIAHLARLEISEDKIPHIQNNLSQILELVAQIERTDTSNSTPMSHPMPGLSCRLREDEVTMENVREEMQAIAPATEAGLYLVPKVIEG